MTRLLADRDALERRSGCPPSRLIVAAALLLAPLVLLAAMYGWLALAHGTWRLLPVVVHEDGQRTLGDTLLYVRHFVRELPVTALYAAMSVGALATYGPASRPRWSGTAASVWAGRTAMTLAGIALVAAAVQAGSATAAWDLLQAYLRDDEWDYGSHWKAHLLSSSGYLAVSVVAAAAVGRSLAGAYVEPHPGARARWIGGCLGAMLALSLLCGPSWQPLVDGHLIGHAARELATHLLITLPLAFGVLLVLGDAPLAAATGATAKRPPPEVLAALAIALAVALFLVAGTLVTGAVGAVRPAASASSLVAAHVFEHALDYLWLVLLCVWLEPFLRPARE